MFIVLILPAFKWLLPFAADVLITIKQTAGTRRRRPQLSIYISCPQGAQQQTSRRPLLLSIYGTGGQTDMDRYMDPAPHTKRASSLVDG